MTPVPLDALALQRWRARHPRLPVDYLDYLRDVGWGQTATGRMIYAGPVAPEEIYGEALCHTSILLLGDDMAGHAFGYDLAAARYGEITPDGQWQAWAPGQCLQDYVAP